MSVFMKTATLILGEHLDILFPQFSQKEWFSIHYSSFSCRVAAWRSLTWTLSNDFLYSPFSYLLIYDKYFCIYRRKWNAIEEYVLKKEICKQIWNEQVIIEKLYGYCSWSEIWVCYRGIFNIIMTMIFSLFVFLFSFPFFLSNGFSFHSSLLL